MNFGPERKACQCPTVSHLGKGAVHHKECEPCSESAATGCRPKDCPVNGPWEIEGWHDYQRKL